MAKIKIPKSEIADNNITSDGKKGSKGRRRIEIKKIEEKNKRHVTFSKRKKGIFNKAAELSVLSGAEIATMVVSSNGKVFCFGTPNYDTVINRYLGHHTASLAAAGQLDHGALLHGKTTRSSNKQVENYVEATRHLEAEKISFKGDEAGFSIQMYHNGEIRGNYYVNGSVDWFDYCDKDRMLMTEIDVMVKELGHEGLIKNVSHWIGFGEADRSAKGVTRGFYPLDPAQG
ncbi:PREDICTED: agamous-like MADS-box protein AGL27 [Prunus mume]|uniref:Agamous-like MADS-box protein AGL27 n=1 Tax=Prunus mume TaxID=102107 RepID=A0ABM0NQL6_PRUMU|nr:PREDICTED: agamous-like MADS-box protein AGL27 [Prunus mume]